MACQIPLLDGRDLRDWWAIPPDMETASVAEQAWTGSNPEAEQAGARLRLFKRTWSLPVTDLPIESIDFISAASACAPFLVAITVE